MSNIEKTERITVRYTPSQLERIIRYAEAKGCSKSRYIRKVTLGEIEQDGLASNAKGLTLEHFDKLHLELSKGGNNINQIAKRINQIYLDNNKDSEQEQLVNLTEEGEVYIAQEMKSYNELILRIMNLLNEVRRS